MSTQNSARIFRALGPGHNLIGEHTDYNDGFVMPAALDFSTWATVSPLEERKLQIFSENFDEEVEVDLDDQNLARARALERLPDRSRGDTRARGLSFAWRQSSNSWRSADWIGIELVGGGRGRDSLCAGRQFRFENRHSRARAAVPAGENEFVGARVGIMDQFVSLFGQAQQSFVAGLSFTRIPACCRCPTMFG